MSKSITFLLIAILASVSAKTEGIKRLSRRLQQTGSSVNVYPSNIYVDGQGVDVFWSLAPGTITTPQDNIALYVAPASTNFNTMVPLKIKSTKGAMSGLVSFQFINYRQDMQAVYVSNSTGKFTPLVTSAVIPNKNPNQPTQIHIAPGTDSKSFTVQWVSANSQSPTVRFGLSANALTTNVTATTKTYTQGDIMQACGWGSTPVSSLPANASMKAVTTGWIDPGVFHLGALTGLNYNTIYYYQVGDAASNNFSPVYSFSTLIAPGSSDNITIIYTADNGIVDADGSARDSTHNGKGTGALAVLTAISTVASQTSGPALAVVNGDISYSDGTLSDWQTYLQEFQATTTKMPLITIPGNHERDYWYNSTVNSNDAILGSSYGGECGIPYETLFQMPNTSHTVQWWSAKYGPVFFMQLDTELDMSPNSPQMMWAASTLASVNRYETPYVVVSLHRAMLTPMPDDNKDTVFGDKLIAYGWDDLFYNNKVTFVLSGHIHLYSRSCPVHAKKCTESGKLDGSVVPSAPVYVVTGWGGPYESSITPKDYWTVEAPAGSFGFLTFKANRQSITMQAIPVDWNVNGYGTKMPMAPIDTVVIPSGQWGQAPPPPRVDSPPPPRVQASPPPPRVRAPPPHPKHSPPKKSPSPKPVKG